jgi:hypothetical protein
MMDRRAFVYWLGAGILTAPLAAETQRTDATSGHRGDAAGVAPKGSRPPNKADDQPTGGISILPMQLQVGDRADAGVLREKPGEA